MNRLELLKAARALISDPKAWIQGFYAKAADGDIAIAFDDNAVCFCAVGAVIHFQGDWQASAEALLDVEAGRFDSTCCSMIDFNDKHTHAEVLAVFDATIDREEKREQAC